MTTINNKDIFPLWFIRYKIVNLRDRHRHFHHPLVRGKEILQKKTWYQCYKNNRNKLIYQHNIGSTRLKLSEWEYLMTFQRMKLLRYYDSLNLWRIREYEVLEKMNHHRFDGRKPIDILWYIAIRRQVSKINKLHSRCRGQISEVHKSSWSHVIYRASKRLQEKYITNHEKSDASWLLNIRYNKNRTYKIHCGNEWSECIFRNFIKRRAYRKGE